uniref:ABC transporter A family member 1 n=1 Tax=Lygus hesperus TaxID=30085 RepID=A0A0A9XS07_LYGHE
MALIIVVLLIFKRAEYVSQETIAPTMLLFFMYGVASMAMAYSLSFLFKDYTTANNTIHIMSFITGFFLVMLILMLSLLPGTEKVSHVLRLIFSLTPTYCLGDGIMKLCIREFQNANKKPVSVWSFDVVGLSYTYLAV